MTLTVNQESELLSAAEQLLTFAENERIFIFNGEMGAGKTTFIKTICKALGVKNNVSSPSFALVNEYQSSSAKIYHFDFYRLKNEVEALDMGCEEYFSSGDYCFIEWPSKIPNYLPKQLISVTIEEQTDGSRTINAERLKNGITE
ncbi:tRNA (adenosine(37)-N6)-threonylcarbamoyltransferase complex ATPase subunit type 1 TsaE [Solitalea koreensis]|uniref:tRNA threonylcarbamoyladenosine biosynthesis protein TsaE n=1 Tax=Solitalea koreensis TaxID=543615 RepID=A0A521B0A4_9SPHI|nr:tRNA (adenosine(37)-N6)-threonylcarbamoyltransferase complex ATPase subunit type 1 TsaE [Solitalea koreensis]SMO40538.1 tRNA threonylcarbamoyladenosine biosynthesis protein TsaE [Solitalea koreensis]